MTSATLVSDASVQCSAGGRAIIPTWAAAQSGFTWTSLWSNEGSRSFVKYSLYGQGQKWA